MINERYSKTPLRKNINGSKVQQSTIYPPISPQDGDTYIITTYNDSLDNIAYVFYNDPSLWWIIAEANALGKGTLKVPAGVQLFIPMNFTQIESDVINLNP
jgi:hypothetical protein